MLDQVLLALAASGGTAVVAAAGTDAWGGVREAAAHWFGGGDEERERAELERLEQTAIAMRTAEPTEAERVRIRQVAAWQDRFEAAFEALDGAQREQAAERLRGVLGRSVPHGGATAGAAGSAIEGDPLFRADNGSVSAGVINVSGGMHVSSPSKPAPSQG